MLIDIFARRYDGTVIRDTFEQRDSRLLVQAFRILAEDMYPYYQNGKEESRAIAFWTNLHGHLSRELGLQELSKQWFSYTTKWNGNDHRQTHKHTMIKVCENWLTQAVVCSPDEYIKERLSLIELGFREREREINAMNAQPIAFPAVRRPTPSLNRHSFPIPIPDDGGVRIKQMRAERTAVFRASVEELNARFRQAGYALNYHNGFIQVLTDDLIQREIENPFWALVISQEWTNVDLDMKVALDLRDSNGRDPAFYAGNCSRGWQKSVARRSIG